MIPAKHEDRSRIEHRLHRGECIGNPTRSAACHGKISGGRRARCTEVLVVHRAGGLPVEIVTEIDDDVRLILGDIAAYSCEGPCA